MVYSLRDLRTSFDIDNSHESILYSTEDQLYQEYFTEGLDPHEDCLLTETFPEEFEFLSKLTCPWNSELPLWHSTPVKQKSTSQVVDTAVGLSAYDSIELGRFDTLTPLDWSLSTDKDWVAVKLEESADDTTLVLPNLDPPRSEDADDNIDCNAVGIVKGGLYLLLLVFLGYILLRKHWVALS